VQVRVSPEVNGLIDEAVTISQRHAKYYVGVEHLLEALVSNAALLPQAFEQSGHIQTLHNVMKLTQANQWQGTSPTAGHETFYTPRCGAVISEAGRLASKLGSELAVAGHLLLAVLADAHGLPSRVMDHHGLDRQRMLVDLRNTLVVQTRQGGIASSSIKSETASQPKAAVQTASATKTQPETAPEPKPKAEEFTRDLTAMAREGKLGKATGRDKECLEMLEILARQNKSNIILVGEAGTGKTKLLEDLAWRCAHGKLEGIVKQSRILELNLSALMSGTQYRGGFEEKVLALLDELKRDDDTILFIDEIHLIMGTGSTDGDGMDLANLLKPALARGEIKCIGATTLKEYRKFIAKDPAIERRFQMLRVEPLSPEATEKVLQRLLPDLEKHHRVKVSSEALRAVITLTERYLPNRHFPDKAIDMLDQACARMRIGAMIGRSDSGKGDSPGMVTPHTVRKVISQAAGVPIEEITRQERENLSGLADRLKEKIIGQDEAVDMAVKAVKKSRAGLADPNRPDGVMLFLGPTGVGKTQLAKELAKEVFGSEDHLITFDMSEYSEAHSVSKLIGAPPGYVGSDEEGLLTGAVQDKPFSILLFDEIEKAHAQIFDLFLPILDEGRLKASDGRLIDFKNCIIIFTSNVGADVIAESGAETNSAEVLDALREHFRPEFINRIDEIVPFSPLLFEDLRSILRIMVNDIRSRLLPKRMGIRMYQRAYEFLAQEGYHPEFGARELRRTVERHIAQPISEKILEGKFEAGDMVEILMDNGVITYRKGKPSSRSKIPEGAAV
jgi:ATP-dependent Clp protease ATP-binding subunit ClpC